MVRFGHHFRLRWWQRGGRDDPQLEVAWNEAESVDVVGRRYDVAKYHHDTDTVLLVKYGDYATVLPAEPLEIYRERKTNCPVCGTAIIDDSECKVCGYDFTA